MKTDELIELLVQDTRVRVNLRVTLIHATVVATLIAGIAFFSMIGFRPDIDTAIKSCRFLFKFVITLALAASSGTVLLRIGQPGAPVRRVALTLLLPVSFLLGAAFFELITLPPETWTARMIGHNSRLCLTIIPSLSVGPLACFLYAMRNAAPEKPGLAGALAGLMAAGIGATFYAANCNDDSPLFVLLWYPMAVCLVVITGWLTGRRILRW